jgi:hypothetical protein
MITPDDIQALARFLVDKHGKTAMRYAELAVDEMEALGDTERADAWRALRSFVHDILEGRLDREGKITVH